MPDSLCLITLGSVIMQIKSFSFLRLIVSSCIAEFDLLRFVCTTLIFSVLLSVDFDVLFAPFATGPLSRSRGDPV